MRRTGGSSSPEFIINEGELLGISLGSDFCAEHEWGIKELSTHMKIISKEKADSKKIFGISRYQINSVHEYSIYFHESEDFEAILLFDPFSFNPVSKTWNSLKSLSIEKLSKEFNINLRTFKNDHGLNEQERIAAAWDSRSFGIHVKGEQEHKLLKELYESIVSLDTIVFLGRPPIKVFSNSSLNIIIRSRIPEECMNEMANRDKEQWELERDAKATGIYEKIKDAGLRYFNLLPCRGKVVRDSRTLDSRSDIKFFLSPFGENNDGWFTVEELEEWTEGKGPVVKKKDKSIASR